MTKKRDKIVLPSFKILVKNKRVTAKGTWPHRDTGPESRLGSSHSSGQRAEMCQPINGQWSCVDAPVRHRARQRRGL